MNTRYIANSIKINADSRRELLSAGQGDNRVILCVAELASDDGTVAFLETNGDPVVLMQDLQSAGDIAEALGSPPEDVLSALVAAVDEQTGYGFADCFRYLR